MLSDHNVQKINDQISDELRIVDGAFTSHTDKMEAIERINQLKSLLSPQPTRQDILAELALAIKEQNTPTTQSPADLVTEIFAAFRR